MIDWQLDLVHIYTHRLHVTTAAPFSGRINTFATKFHSRSRTRHKTSSLLMFIMWPVSIQVVELALSRCVKVGRSDSSSVSPSVMTLFSLAAKSTIVWLLARRVGSIRDTRAMRDARDEKCGIVHLKRATLECDWILFIRENLGAISFNLFSKNRNKDTFSVKWIPSICMKTGKNTQLGNSSLM